MSSNSSHLFHKSLNALEVSEERAAQTETGTDVSLMMSSFTSLKRQGVVETKVHGVESVINPGEETQFAGICQLLAALHHAGIEAGNLVFIQNIKNVRKNGG